MARACRASSPSSGCPSASAPASGRRRTSSAPTRGGVRAGSAPGGGGAALSLPLAELSVDEPALRAEAGLDTQPGEADIAATRTNMLDKVLEVQRFPFALIGVKTRADAQLDV